MYVCIYKYICMNMYGLYIWKICIFIFIITCNTHTSVSLLKPYYTHQLQINSIPLLYNSNHMFHG